MTIQSSGGTFGVSLCSGARSLGGCSPAIKSLRVNRRQKQLVTENTHAPIVPPSRYLPTARLKRSNRKA